MEFYGLYLNSTVLVFHLFILIIKLMKAKYFQTNLDIKNFELILDKNAKNKTYYRFIYSFIDPLLSSPKKNYK